jgi:adenosine deaminase
MLNEVFKKYLTENNLEGLKTIPKSDVHNHASNGGNPRYIEKIARIKLNSPSKLFKTINEMEEWAHKEIKIHCNKLQRWEAAFIQAADDNIRVLAMSFGRHEMDCHGKFPSVIEFINFITVLKNKYLSTTIFLPELAFHMESDIDYENSIIDEILSYNFFKSIDIWAEFQPAYEYKKFKPLFSKAKGKGLRLKAHVGEFNNADDVMEVVEELELHEVQHGIAASTSVLIMKWLAKNNIQLNVCPTCNILLSRVKNYKEHPIRILYDYDIPVTINTDDMLICNQSVSQEYLNLYKCGLMNVDELDKIRMTGLSALNHYTV